MLSTEPSRLKAQFKCGHLHMNGFTLVELSLVLVVISLLLGSFLPTMQQQRYQMEIRQSTQKLETARDALTSYALLNGYLPCPDWQNNPTESTYGLAAESCINPSSEGWLPFRTLGLSEGDSWMGIVAGSNAGRISYRVDPAFTRSFGQRISLTTSFASNLSVVDLNGSKLTSDAERPVAILISLGPNGLLNGENASYEQDNQVPRYESHPPTASFDDLVVWLGRPSLFSILVKGGAGL